MRSATVKSALVSMLVFCGAAWAQEPASVYPSKNVLLIDAQAAGGPADLEARLYAKKMNGYLGQNFIIDSKPGAGTTIASAYVARAKPDGYTLQIVTGSFTIFPALYTNLSFDTLKDFAPVSLMSQRTTVLIAHPSFPASTLREFVEYCKGRGLDKVSYGSPGVGGTGHLAMEYLQARAGIRLKHVAYDSRSLMIKDLLAGRILIAMDNLPPYLRHIQSGALQALGVSSARQWFAAPDVPSIAEQGYPDFEAALWWYIAAPAGTPLELVKKLSDEIVKGVRSETASRKIRESGASERPGNTEDLAKHITAERIKWKKVIEGANIAKWLCADAGLPRFKP